jgi:hypothetical protein
VEEQMASEVLVDLIRSAWIVEASRARLYDSWAETHEDFTASGDRARVRAGLLEVALADVGRAPDRDLVDAHTRWLAGLGGETPDETPLGHLFLVRIGDWVDAHAAPFMATGAEELQALGEAERAAAVWPSGLPAPPPFDPVEEIPVEPPGEAGFRFGILGDLHIGSKTGEPMARAAIADLNRSGAELVIQLGDITDHGDKDEFELATEVLSGLEMPFATMMGNHDVLSVKEGRLSGREYYPASFGREPDGVLLEHRGFRFAVLDSAEHGASPFAPFDLVTGQFSEGPGGAIVRGAFTQPQHDILADLAAPGAPPAFVFLHHPPQPFTAFPPVLFGLRDEDTSRLHATCDSKNVWGVFAGHTHRNARTRDFDGVPAQEVAIARDYPFGYALVDVTDQGYAYRFVQISDFALLREAYEGAGRIQRRYALGSEEERAFVWTRPGA